MLGAAPAGASFDDNTIGCDGAAALTADDGKQTTVRASDDEVAVPRSGTAAWQGSIATVTHNHRGAVDLALGPFSIQLDQWGPSRNVKDEASATGTKEIPSAVGSIPPGRYVVSGFHEGDEGRCSGSVIVVIEGSPLTNPAGAVAALGTLVTAALLALAARAKAVAP